MNLSRLEILASFGFKKDPFRGVLVETEDMRRVNSVLDMAIDAHAMLSIIGERGIGKTELIERVLKARDCKVVRLSAADKEAVKIGDIETELIYGISSEAPSRSRVKRSMQVKSLLRLESTKRFVGKGQEIVLLIEEAHRIHGQTLRSLKTLREPDGGGEPQFTVIFVGQYNFLATKKGVDEVGSTDVYQRTNKEDTHPFRGVGVRGCGL